MPVNPWPLNDRGALIADRAFVGVFAALVVLSVLWSRGLIGDSRGHQATATISFASALLVQSVGALVGRRSRRWSYVVLAASLLILAFGAIYGGR